MSTAKTRIFGLFAEIARVLGNAHRLALLEHIAQGERSVERLAELSDLSIANTSAHLQQLRRSGLVQVRRSGKNILYRLGDGQVLPLLSALRCYTERNRSEIKDVVAEYFDKLDQVEPVAREELIGRMRKGKVTLLDVRHDDEYALGHLPGALNLPIDMLEQRLSELPRDNEIVAYCRGPYCILSFEAVALLRKHGFNVRRLEDGFPEWKAAGYDVEVAA